MRIRAVRAAALAAVLISTMPARAAGQHTGHQAAAGDSAETAAHEMWSTGLGGWRLTGMGQLYPIVTFGAPFQDDGPFRETAWYVTQPVAMATLASPGSRLVLRATVDLEGLTQDDGELAFGSWGEGFLDRRHPHTLLHELVVSVNAWSVLGGAASLSAGKAFAAYGSDDPMGRPGLKYPTNHHLSQILERWGVTGAFVRGGWSIEASVFGGNEPEDAYDLLNITPFGNSWSARLARRWGGGYGPLARWEATLSYGDVREEHGHEAGRTRLVNATVRHESDAAYGLLEASHSDPEHDASYFSVLAEAALRRGPHEPYARVEYATRPEWQRLGPPGSEDFFRYDHDAEPIGATRWLIATAGYGYETTGYPFSVRPFIDVQYFHATEERGGIEPRELFGSEHFWGVSLGARIFFGGDPMRMGAYGVLDPMTAMHMAPTAAMPPMHGSAH